MRGMFAVAIWDAAQRRLILARDRVGKKPLYYYRHRDELLFGSETKAILAALDQAPPIHAPALLDFLTFGYVAGGNAIFEGMHRLEPGTALIVDVGAGTLTHERYWSWPGRRVRSIHARKPK
jgi:asparagine synthase (glutamine-hydrolysing)